MTREAFKCVHCGFLANAEDVRDGGHVIQPRVPSLAELARRPYPTSQPDLCGPMEPYQTSASVEVLAHVRYGPGCAFREGAPRMYTTCQGCLNKAMVPILDILTAQALALRTAFEGMTFTVNLNPRRPERWRKRKGDRFDRWTK